MSDDYLWDRSGGDEDVERLEKLLDPLALKSRTAPRVAPLSPRRLLIAAVAAAALVAVLSQILRPEPPRTIEFKLGRFDIEPDARVRVLHRTDELIKLRLDRGTIHASISLNARPRLFQVETPATTCVDLGCHYTLTVDKDGRSVVHVDLGRVAFEDGDREVFIPRDAGCRAVPGRGSGTPVFDDAPAEFVEAIHAFDDASGHGRVAAARVVAERARAKDKLSLWHLFRDPDRTVAEIGLDALERVVGAPAGIPRDVTLRHDSFALHAWWDRLDLDPYRREYPFRK